MLNRLFLLLSFVACITEAGFGKNIGFVALTLPPIALAISKNEYKKDKKNYKDLQNWYQESTQNFDDTQKKTFGQILKYKDGENILPLDQTAIDIAKKKTSFWKNIEKTSELLVAVEIGVLLTYAKMRKNCIK